MWKIFRPSQKYYRLSNRMHAKFNNEDNHDEIWC